MNRLEWWTFIYYIFISLHNSKVQSQCLYDGGKNGPTSADLFVEISNELSNPSLSPKNQLMNTLLTVAATKGVLPELATALQPSLSSDTIETSPALKTNVSPVLGNSPTEIRQDYPPGKAISGSTQSNPIQGYYQIPVTPELFQGISQQSITGFPSDNYFYTTDYLTPQSILETSSDMFKYFSSIPESDFTPECFKSLINNSDNIAASGIPCQAFKQPIVVTSESDNIPPFNIEINVPLPQIPDQIATILSNEKSLTAPNMNFGSPPDIPLPIVISKGKSSSSLKKMLPIMLLAMLLDDNDGCCSCRCDPEPNYIPIPYPFPVPIPYQSKYDSVENDSSEEFVFC